MDSTGMVMHTCALTVPGGRGWRLMERDIGRGGSDLLRQRVRYAYAVEAAKAEIESCASWAGEGLCNA